MKEFSKAIRDYKPSKWCQYLIEDLELKRYKSQIRKIHHTFKSYKELDVLILNFAHFKECAIFAHCRRLSRNKMGKAIKTLLNSGYITIQEEYSNNTSGKGRSRIYQRTPEFEQVFKFRLSEPRISQVLPIHSNNSSSILPSSLSISSLIGAKLASKSGIGKKFEALVSDVRLSMSKKGLHVNPDVDLYRVNGRRLYAKGRNYQILKKEHRKYLLINGEPTVEIDFDNLHPNLLLNICDCEGNDQFYERILNTLGLRVSQKRRKFIKRLVCASFNIANKWAFTWMVKGKFKSEWQSLLNGIKPREIYGAIKSTYPMLSPYICTGDHSDWLQTADSEIMIEILETLASENIIALPLHDSIILPEKHKDRGIEVMESVYKEQMSYDIGLKIK